MEHDQQNIEYVYDFIYLDSPRLISYLAQIDQNGILLSIKKTGHIQEEVKNLSSIGLNNATRQTNESNESVGKHIERHFDSNAASLYSVIDKLDELGFVTRDLDNVNIGQLILSKGFLSFRDIRLILKLWDPLNKLVTASGQKNNHKNNKLSNSIKDVLAALPHTLLMILNTNDSLIWSSLEESHLKINADDITLKHGSSFAGQWHVLGIIDAKPDHQDEPNNASFHNDLFDSMIEVLDSIRNFIGRPSIAYGITPIAIFRTVNKS